MEYLSNHSNVIISPSARKTNPPGAPIFRPMQRARPYNRDEALEAALRLFWDKGYHATSLKDLEAALSMKPGSIYAAFTSKENLFVLALERYFQAALQEFRTIVAEAETPVEGLAAFARSIATSDAGSPKQRACMLIKTLLTTTEEDRAIATAAGNYLDQMEAEMETVFKAAVRAGELPADANTQRLARRYQSDVSALKLEAFRGLPRAELLQSAEDMAQELKALRPDHV